jgi:hypothetical protein
MTPDVMQGDMAEAIAPFAAVLERDEFREALERVCLARWRCRPLSEPRVTPLRSHRRRCTFDVEVPTEHGGQHLIAKAYARDRSDVFQYMVDLAHAGFGPDTECSIPQPFEHLSSLGVRLEERVPGPSMKDIITTGDADEWTASAERCGHWLGRFHRVAPRSGSPAGILGELSSARQASTRMTDDRARFAGKARALLEGLDAATPSADAGLRCAGHGSYMPDHVIVSGRRAAVIDLDEYDVADPARDVAWFLVSLRRRAIQLLGARYALDAAAAAFVQAYVAAGPTDALHHLPFYQALECMHRARRDLYKQSTPLPEWTEFMLDEGLRALAS